MKKVILYIILLLFALPAYCDYRVTGGSKEPYPAEEGNNIRVYLLDGLTSGQITFTSKDIPSHRHQWYKYRTRATEAVPVTSTIIDSESSAVTGIEDGYAYFVGEINSSKTRYVWIIDYSKYKPIIHSLNFSEEIIEDEDKENLSGKCLSIRLIIDMEAEKLTYRTPDGIRKELLRKFHLEYNDLVWKDNLFVTGKKEQACNGPLSEIILPDAPLMNTSFTLRGDDFAEYFDYRQNQTTGEYEAKTFEVHTFAYLKDKDGTENEYTPENNPLPGSNAPVSVRFEAYSNDIQGTMYLWKIFKINPATGERETSESFRYTTPVCEPEFTQSGTYEVELELGSTFLSSSCRYKSDPYEFLIFIEESMLELPNAFSPGSSVGDNDIYKVKHKSLISFKASIFNRWGNLLYRWNDPDQGWDGKVSGKYVPTGVYFIVVEARGADGKTYKINGDINILRARNK